MAARFSLSSDSDSEPSEEVEEGESGSFATEKERQALSRHTLTLPELRLTGRKQISQLRTRKLLCPFYFRPTQLDVQADQPHVTPEDICEGLMDIKTSIMWLNALTAPATMSRFCSNQSDQGQLGVPSDRRIQRGRAPGVRGR